MRTLTPMVFLALLTLVGDSVAQQTLESKGITSKIKLEEVVATRPSSTASSSFESSR